MAKTFKRNQPIVAKLPTGRVVEGLYIEPYGSNGHSFYVNEPSGVRGNKVIYKKTMYGVQDEFIEPMDKHSMHASNEQYKAWLIRAMSLEDRIKEDKKLLAINKYNDNEVKKLERKIARSEDKLMEINNKINEFEGEE
jgi:hypothetical protein